MKTNPTPTPPLVDVIAEAIRASRTEMIEPPPGEHVRSLAQTTPEHQARAVLDALTKAGGVEVVTGYGVKLKSGDVERTGMNIQDAKGWLEDVTGGDNPDYEPVEVVTRTTTTIIIRTDWTAVEG